MFDGLGSVVPFEVESSSDAGTLDGDGHIPVVVFASGGRIAVAHVQKFTSTVRSNTRHVLSTSIDSTSRNIEGALLGNLVGIETDLDISVVTTGALSVKAEDGAGGTKCEDRTTSRGSAKDNFVVVGFGEGGVKIVMVGAGGGVEGADSTIGIGHEETLADNGVAVGTGGVPCAAIFGKGEFMVVDINPVALFIDKLGGGIGIVEVDLGAVSVDELGSFHAETVGTEDLVALLLLLTGGGKEAGKASH